MEDFCCGTKSKLFQDLPSPRPATSCSWDQSERGSAEPPCRTDPQPGSEDPGGSEPVGPASTERLYPPHLESQRVLELKRSQQCSRPSNAGNHNLITANSHSQGKPSHFAASGGQTHYQASHHLSSQPMQPQYSPQPTSPPHPDTDSALEAAVNSILEC